MDELENTAGNLTDPSGPVRPAFPASDRNVINLPGVVKCFTFQVIRITSYGRRIQEFELDHTRNHSPIIEKIGESVDEYRGPYFFIWVPN